MDNFRSERNYQEAIDLTDELYQCLVGIMDIEKARIATGAFRPNNIAKERIERADRAIIRYQKGR